MFNMYENPFDKSLSGLEIKDWIWYNASHKTKYTALAKGMGAMFNLDDNKFYMLTLCDGKPTIKEVSQRGETVENPCDG